MVEVPFLPLDHIHGQLASELVSTFKDVLSEGHFILGRRLQSFEQRFAGYVGAHHAVGVGSGHDALLLSLKALGVGPGDEVIIPAHTFFATPLAVYHTGAKPVPVDVEPQTCNIDVKQIEAVINPRTRAIIPVHLYGTPAEMDTIQSLARANNLFVVEDFAQSHGALYKQRQTGSLGDINATSFYPVKNLGALGDGGMVTTNSTALAKKVAILRNYGSEEKHVFTEAGSNSRLDEIQAALLEVKLQYLDAWNAERRKIAHQYITMLSEIEAVGLPGIPEGVTPVFHIFAIQTEKRDSLRSYLRSKGIETLVHYPVPLHHQPAAIRMGLAGGTYPVAEKIAGTQLSLPVYPGLRSAQIEHVAQAIRTFFSKNRV
jgi:dTDP-4-amino-4,6-dideoxygalactose transaminase